MAHFDRFDICEAYFVLEMEFHEGGWLHERPSNQRRREACSVQLARMRFRPALNLGGYEDLNRNAREIYDDACVRFNLPVPLCKKHVSDYNPDYRWQPAEPLDAFGYASCHGCIRDRKENEDE